MTDLNRPFITVTEWNLRNGMASRWTARAVGIDEIVDVRSRPQRHPSAVICQAVIECDDGDGYHEWIVCSETFNEVISYIRVLQPIEADS